MSAAISVVVRAMDTTRGVPTGPGCFLASDRYLFMDSNGKSPDALAPQGSWLPRQTGELRRRLGALGFGARLFLVLFIVLALVGTLAYVLVSDHLEGYEIDSYARDQRADAEGFEDLARENPP